MCPETRKSMKKCNGSMPYGGYSGGYHIGGGGGNTRSLADDDSSEMPFFIATLSAGSGDGLNFVSADVVVVLDVTFVTSDLDVFSNVGAKALPKSIDGGIFVVNSSGFSVSDGLCVVLPPVFSGMFMAGVMDVCGVSNMHRLCDHKRLRGRRI